KDIGIRTKLRNKIKKEKEKVLRDIKKGKFEEIQDMKGMGSKSFKKFMNYLARLNSEFTDGKVTIDTKRILRLPSSLHSKVSRKCTLIKEIDSFSFNEAVPNFIREG
ncbi:MAG: DNA primase catalytic subunit PriS, partial [Hadesarchaea archaeon]|nr:DNA primase catalytic subunit PriS [Hadesarchaea archaeon]